MSLARVGGWTAVLAVLAVVGAESVRAQAGTDFIRLDKIDVHVHLNAANSALVEQAQADGFRLLTINVDYPDFPPIAEQRRIALSLREQHPSIVAFAATFSMQGWGQPGWDRQVIADLDAAFRDGAVGVKVWKNIGMAFHDHDGRLVMIDDPGFDPVFAFIRERDKVLIGHQGEPYNCWLPLEQMTVNNDREYFREHPQYHMYLHPELPGYRAQMDARDHMLTRHPQLRFMGAHLASLEWSVTQLSKFLDRFPSAVVDLAARMGQLQYQSTRNRARVRRFFVRYQDRLLYGTDLTQEPAAVPETVRHEAHEVWSSDWRYLASDETFKVAALDAPVRGLALPRPVLEKIYGGNARRWFKGAFPR